MATSYPSCHRSGVTFREKFNPACELGNGTNVDKPSLALGK
jgi:hypothetical protein